MGTTESTRAILLAKGYRPYTLAADLGVSWKVAKRILHGKEPLFLSDAALLHNRLGVSMSFLFDSPGSVANRERRETEQRPFEPYNFENTLGGNNLLAAVGPRSHTLTGARERYNRFLEENSGNPTKDSIEAEALRIVKEYFAGGAA